MQLIRSVTEDLLYVGGSDRRLSLFENVYPVPAGVSYNSYVMLDEKTALFDTADAAIAEQFLANVAAALGGRKLDYVIVNHMEPDHCATLGQVLTAYPEAQVIGTAKAVQMMGQFFDLDLTGRTTAVKEGETLALGRHTLRFVTAPMVHWPEVMVTYDETDKTLFSADAFGTFGALNGNIFADELNFERDILAEARRYYTNIVGKYGTQVQGLLKKAAGLEIARICPLHGPIWREDLSKLIGLYQLWSTYTPEEKGVVIAVGSIYGHTMAAAEYLALRLGEKGVKNIALYDASQTDESYILADAFRFSHLVLASVTYNGGLYTPMETFLSELKAHNLQSRTVALIENGSWAAVSGKIMAGVIGEMKNMTLLEGTVSLKSAAKAEQLAALDALADQIAAGIVG